MLLELRDPAAIERALRRDPELHAYELGDLDPFFSPRPRWLALDRGGRTALLSDGATLLLLAGESELAAAGDLLPQLGGVLPPRSHGPLSTGLDARLPA